MANTTKKICVAGSLNVDLTLRLERFHQPGETVTAKSIHTYAGGKGGNQAVAAAKLGHPVMMVGMLGEDDYGRFYREVLKENGVDATCVGSDAHTPSGMAVIEVDDRGENRIAIIPGTNGLVNNAYMDGVMGRMLGCDIFLLQYEIDLGTECLPGQDTARCRQARDPRPPRLRRPPPRGCTPTSISSPRMPPSWQP